MPFQDQAIFQQSWGMLELSIMAVSLDPRLALIQILKITQQILCTLKMKGDQQKVHKAQELNFFSLRFYQCVGLYHAPSPLLWNSAHSAWLCLSNVWNPKWHACKGSAKIWIKLLAQGSQEETSYWCWDWKWNHGYICAMQGQSEVSVLERCLYQKGHHDGVTLKSPQTVYNV